MSKRDFLTRYMLIIKKLQTGPATFEQISDYLKRESELEESDFNLGLRQFQRDKNDILTMWGIQIEYDRSRGLYYIADEGRKDWNLQIIEAYEMFDALRLSDKLSSRMFLERRRAKGTEHLHGILHAIGNRKVIRFSYQKFWEDEKTKRTGEPYALKEFKNRWYLLMMDPKDRWVKNFGLDRITDLEILNKTFPPITEFSIQERFQNCFGIMAPYDQKPEEIILSFTPVQGKYQKSMPLHEPYEVLVDNDKEFRIKIHLYITDDLVRELLSLEKQVKVIKPKKLIDKMCILLRESLKQYV